ncbi:MAG: polysaccharide deacetylase [Magnetococcales bacterium]|nr:polysaccharide deacetylase [Magnetococcales bacterium]
MPTSAVPPVLSRRMLGRLLLGCALTPLPLLAADGPRPCRLDAPYRPVRQFRKDASGRHLLVLREFEQEGTQRLVTLDPATLATAIEDAARLPWSADPPATFAQSPYALALHRQTAPPHPLINDGLRRAAHPAAGFCLSIDLCPSPRPMDHPLFEALLASPLPRPIPVAIAVSGGWIRRHPDDFAWLRAHDRPDALAITWINHTLTHFYARDRRNADNFLLAPGSDPVCEALSLEWLLLQNGVTPTPFFRFPGLVSNRESIATLTDLGLLVVGCDAIMADGDPIRDGGILLLHGNGNEPHGVKRFLRLLAANGTPALLPLASLV